MKRLNLDQVEPQNSDILEYVSGDGVKRSFARQWYEREDHRVDFSGDIIYMRENQVDPCGP